MKYLPFILFTVMTNAAAQLMLKHGMMVLGPLTGAGFNPARSLGPAIVSGEFNGVGDFVLVYVVAPVIGGLLGALAYHYLVIAPGQKGLGGAEPVGYRTRPRTRRWRCRQGSR